MEENLNDKLIPLTNAKPEEVDEALTGQPTTVQKTDKELRAEEYQAGNVVAKGADFSDVGYLDKNLRLRIQNNQDGYLGMDLDPLMDRTFVTGLDQGETFDDPARLYDKSQEAQGVFEKIFNGSVQFAGDTVLNVGQGIGGTFYGLGSAIANQEFSKFYDNSVTNALDRAEEYWGKTFEVKTGGNQGALQQGANFIFNDLFGGLSFLVGAVATEAILSAVTVGTGGGAAGIQAAATAGLVARGSRIMKNIANGGRRVISGKYVDEVARGVAALGDDATRVAAAGGITSAASQVNKAMRYNTYGRVARQWFTGAGMEASMEARHTLNEAVEEERREYESRYGVGSFTDEKEQAVREQYEPHTNAAFLTNFALVGVSNMVMFPKIFGTRMRGQMFRTRLRDVNKMSTSQQTRLARRLGVDKAALPKYIESRGSFDLNTLGFGKATNMGKLARGTAILRRGAYEGVVEEGLQGVIARSTKDYLRHKYDEENQTQTVNFMDNLSEGFQGSYGTKEGLKEVGIGMLLGMMGAPWAAKVKSKDGKKDVYRLRLLGGYQDVRKGILERDEKMQRILDLHEKDGGVLEILRAEVENNVVQNGLQNDMDAAALAGDFKRMKDIEQNQIFSHAASKIVTGRYDDALVEAKSILDDMTADDYRQMLGKDGDSMSDQEVLARKIDVYETYENQMKAAKTAFDRSQEIYRGRDPEVNTAIANTLYNIEAYDMREKKLAQTLADNIKTLNGDTILSGQRIQHYLNISMQDIEKMSALREKIRRIEKGLQTKLERKIIKNIDADKAAARLQETQEAEQELANLREQEEKLTQAFMSRAAIEGEYNYNREEQVERINALVDMHEALDSISLVDTELNVSEIQDVVASIYEISEDRIALIRLHNQILEEGGLANYIASIESVITAGAELNRATKKRAENNEDNDADLNSEPSQVTDRDDDVVAEDIDDTNEDPNYYDDVDSAEEQAREAAAAEEGRDDDISEFSEEDIADAEEDADGSLTEDGSSEKFQAPPEDPNETETEPSTNTTTDPPIREEEIPEENDAPRNVTSTGKLWLNIETEGRLKPNVTDVQKHLALNGSDGFIFRAKQISGDEVEIVVDSVKGERPTFPGGNKLMSVGASNFENVFGEGSLALANSEAGYTFSLEIESYGSGVLMHYKDKEGVTRGGPRIVGDVLSDPKNQLVEVVYSVRDSENTTFFSALTGKDISNSSNEELKTFLAENTKTQRGLRVGSHYAIVRDNRTQKLTFAPIKGNAIGISSSRFILRALQTLNIASGAQTKEQHQMSDQEFDHNVRILEENFDVDFGQEGFDLAKQINKVIRSISGVNGFKSVAEVRERQQTAKTNEIQIFPSNNKKGAQLVVYKAGINPKEQLLDSQGNPRVDNTGKPFMVKSSWKSDTTSKEGRSDFLRLMGQIRHSSTLEQRSLLSASGKVMSQLDFGDTVYEDGTASKGLTVEPLESYEYIANNFSFGSYIDSRKPNRGDRGPIEIVDPITGERRVYANRVKQMNITPVNAGVNTDQNAQDSEQQEAPQAPSPQPPATESDSAIQEEIDELFDNDEDVEGFDSNGTEGGAITETSGTQSNFTDDDLGDIDEEDDGGLFGSPRTTSTEEQDLTSFTPRGSVSADKLSPMDRAAKNMRVQGLSVKQTEELINILVGLSAHRVQVHSVTKRRGQPMTLASLKRNVYRSLTGTKKHPSAIRKAYPFLEKAERDLVKTLISNSNKEAGTKDIGYSLMFDQAFFLAAQRLVAGTHGLLKLGPQNLNELSEAYDGLTDLTEENYDRADLSMKEFEDKFSFTVDPKATQGVLLRRQLMAVRYTHVDSNTRTFLGLRKYIDYSTLSGILNQELAGINPNFNEVQEKLQKSTAQYPYIKDILRTMDISLLDKSDPLYNQKLNNMLQLRQQFVVFASKDAVTYISTKHNINQGAFGTVYLFSSNERNMGVHALQNFLSKLVTNGFYNYTKGIPEINQEKFKSFVAELDKITESENSTKTKADLISQLFESELRMNVPAHLFNSEVPGMEDIEAELGVGNSQMDPISAFGHLRYVMRMAASGQISKRQNIMALPQTMQFKKFFMLSATQGDDLIQNTSKDAAGNLRWHYVMPKLLSDKIKSIKDSTDEEIEELSVYLQNNLLYKMSQDSKLMSSKLKLDYYDAHSKLRSSMNPKEWLKMSPGDRKLAQLILYGNDNQYIQRKGQKVMLSRFTLPTIADKETMPVIQVSSTSVQVNNKILLKVGDSKVSKKDMPIADLRIEHFINTKNYYRDNIKSLVDQELTRINNIEEENFSELPTEAQRQANKIIMFPELNVLLENKHSLRSMKGSGNRDAFHKDAEVIITAALNRDMQEGLEQMHNSGIFDLYEETGPDGTVYTDSEGNEIPRIRQEGAMSNLRFFNKAHHLAKGDVTGKSSQEFIANHLGLDADSKIPAKQMFLAYHAKFVAESRAVRAHTVQAVTGDVGVYWKKDVSSTLKNMQKRLAALIAPGTVVPSITKEDIPNTPGVDSMGNTVVKRILIKDFKTNASNLAELKKLLPDSEISAYLDIETTDAAEYITPRERLLNLLAEGKISRKQFSGLLVKAESGQPLEKEDMGFFRPGKPVAAGDHGTHHFYIKSAEFVLLPSDIQGTSLMNLYDFMVATGVGRATHESAYKVGRRANTAIDIYNDDGSVRKFTAEEIEDVAENLTGKRYDQNRSTFKIQQQVPVKTKLETVHGTQISRLFDVGLQNEIGFDEYGVFNAFRKDGKLRGKDLKAIYNNARGIENQAKKVAFYKKYGVGTPEYKVKMAARLREEGANRGYGMNEMAALHFDPDTQLFSVPLWGTASAQRIDSLLISIVESEIIKPRTLGFSGPIAPEIGYAFEKLSKAQKSSISWLTNAQGNPLWKGESLGTTTKDKPYDEIILPWKFKADVEKFKDENGNIDINRIDSQLLDVFGYRLPTQAKASSSSFRVVGFSGPEMGDRIIVPKELVGRIGQDYDIDKLFTLMFDHEVSDLKVDKPRLLKKASLSKSEVDSYTDKETLNETLESMDVEALEEIISRARNTQIDVYHSSHRNPAEKVRQIIHEPIGDGYAEELADIVNAKGDLILDPMGVSYNDFTTADASAGATALGVFAVQGSLHATINSNNLDIYFAQGNYMDVVEIGQNKGQSLMRKGKAITKASWARLGKDEVLDDTFVLVDKDTKAGTVTKQFNRMMNHALDNQNNGLLGDLRISRETYPLWSMLTHHGYNQETIELIVSSSVIKEVVSVAKSRSAMTSGNFFEMSNYLNNEAKIRRRMILQAFSSVDFNELEGSERSKAIKQASVEYGKWRRSNKINFDVNKEWLVADFKGQKLGEIEQQVYELGIIELFQKTMNQSKRLGTFSDTLRRDSVFPAHRQELNMMIQDTSVYYYPNRGMNGLLNLPGEDSMAKSNGIAFGDWNKVLKLANASQKVKKEHGADSKEFEASEKAIRQFKQEEMERLRTQILQNTHPGQLADMVMNLKADGVFSLSQEHVDRTHMYDTALAYFQEQSQSVTKMHSWLKGLRSYHFAKLAEKIDGTRNAREIRQSLLVNPETNLASKITRAKQKFDFLDSNPFLKHLILNVDTTAHGYYTVEFTGDRNLNVSSQELLGGMHDILTHKQEEIRNLGKDIVLYSLVTGGGLGSRSFSKYVLSEYLEENGIRQELMTAVDKDTMFWDTEAHRQIVMHNHSLIPRAPEFGQDVVRSQEEDPSERTVIEIGFLNGSQDGNSFDKDPTLNFGFFRDKKSNRPHEIGKWLRSENVDGLIWNYYEARQLQGIKGNFLHKEYSSYAEDEQGNPIGFTSEVEIRRTKPEEENYSDNETMSDAAYAEAEESDEGSLFGTGTVTNDTTVTEDAIVEDSFGTEEDQSNTDKLIAGTSEDLENPFEEPEDGFDDSGDGGLYGTPRTRVVVPVNESPVEAFVNRNGTKLNAVLEKIMLMESMIPKEKQVRIVAVSDMNKVSAYNVGTHTISARADITDAEFTHELVHAYTVWALTSKDPRVKEQMQQLETLRRKLTSDEGLAAMGLKFSEYQKFLRGNRVFRAVQFREKNISDFDAAALSDYQFFNQKENQDKFYGLTSIQELLSETMTNARFAEQLSKVNSEAGARLNKAKGTSAWSKILQLAADMLEAMNITFGPSAATEISSIAASVISKRARSLGTSVPFINAEKSSSESKNMMFTPRKEGDVRNANSMIAYKKIRIEEFKAVRAKFAGNNSALKSIDRRIAQEKADIEALSDDSVSAKSVLMMVERELDDIDNIMYRMAGKMPNKAYMTSILSAQTALAFYSRFAKQVKLNRESREKVRELVGRANAMQDDYLDILREALRKYAKKLYTGSPTQDQITDDSFETMESLNFLRANLMSAGRQGRIELSFLDDVLKVAYDEQKTDYTTRVEAYDILSAAFKETDYYKKHGWDGLVELDADGKPTPKIISPVSGKWSLEEHKRRTVALSENSEAGWKNYYAWLTENTDRVDVERLYNLDVRDVTRKDDPAYILQLEKKFGKVGTRELLARQDKLMDRYADAKVAAFDVIDMNTTGEGFEASRKAQKIAWVNLNSPAAHYKYYTGEAMRPRNAQNQFLYHMPLPNVTGKETGFLDERFEELQREDDALAYYNFLRSQFKEMMASLPLDTYAENIHAVEQGLFLPAIRKKMTMDIITPKTVVLKQHNRFVQSIVSTDEELESRMIDPVTGEFRRELPVHFMKQFSDLKEQEFNMDKVYKKFTMMATTYKAKNEVEDIVRITETTLNNVGVAVTNGRGEKMVNKLTGLAYIRESGDARQNITKAASASIREFYGQSKMLNEKYLVGAKRARTMEEKKKEKELKNIIAEADERLEKGTLTEDQHAEIVDPVKEKIEALGSRVDLGKVLRGLTKFTQARGMGWNVPAAFTNYIFGSMAVYQHAARRTDFDERDADKAFRMMLHMSLHTATLRSGLSETETAKKIQGMMLRLDVLKDFTEVRYDPLDDETTFDQLVKAFGVYELQRSSEYFTYGHATVAALLGTKIGDSNAWELMDDKGIIQAEGFRPGEKNWTKLTNKINQINMSIHGNYDPQSPIALKQTMLGPALMQFKSWVPEGFAQETQGKIYDLHLEREVQGMIPAIWGEKGAWFAQLPKMLIPIYRRHAELDFSNPVTEENARKAYAKLYQYLSLAMMASFFKVALDDEDDEDAKGMMIFLMNIADRLKNDLSYFYNPRSYQEVTKGMPTTETLADVFKFAEATMQTMGGDATIPTGVYAGRSRMLHHGGKLIPMGNAIQRMEYNTTTQPK